MWWRPAARISRQTRDRGRSAAATSGCRRAATSARFAAASSAAKLRHLGRRPARSRPARRAARRRPRPARSACPPAARSPPGRAGRWRRRERHATRFPASAPDRRSRSPIWSSCRTRRGSRVPGRPRARACRAPTWPTNRIIGVESCRAIWMPGEALVAPGPRVTKQTPGRPVALPTASAIIAAPPSWRHTVTAMSGHGTHRAPRR